MNFKLLFVLVIQLYLTGRAFTGFVPPNLCFDWSSPAPKNVSGSFDLIEASCLGGDAALLSTGVWLNYNVTYATPEGLYLGSYVNRVWVKYNATPFLEYGQENIEQARNITTVQYHFHQPEHGGGRCHCLKVYFRANCEDGNSINDNGE